MICTDCGSNNEDKDNVYNKYGVKLDIADKKENLKSTDMVIENRSKIDVFIVIMLFLISGVVLILLVFMLLQPEKSWRTV